MAFTSEERQMLAESVERFISDEYAFDKFRKLDAAPDGFGREEWQTYAELGWLGIAIPEEYGGAGGGMADMAMIMEFVGKGLLREPYLSTVVLGAGLVEHAGSEAQKVDILPEIAKGKLLVAFAHVEPDAGFTRDWVRAIAKKTGNGYLLTGNKSFVLQGNSADGLIVSARLDGADGPIGLFFVDAKSDGIVVKGARGIDARPVAAITFENVKVAASDRLEVGDAAAVIDQVLDRATLAISAEAVGAMEASNSATLDYVKTRKQFGKTIGSFQALQHRLVDMRVLYTEARALVAEAIKSVDTDAPDKTYLISAAKVRAADAAKLIGAESIQLHGGMGMTDELAIGHYYKRLLALEPLFGNAEWHLDRMISEETV